MCIKNTLKRPLIYCTTHWQFQKKTMTRLAHWHTVIFINQVIEKIAPLKDIFGYDEISVLPFQMKTLLTSQNRSNFPGSLDIHTNILKKPLILINRRKSSTFN